MALLETIKTGTFSPAIEDHIEGEVTTYFALRTQKSAGPGWVKAIEDRLYIALLEVSQKYCSTCRDHTSLEPIFTSISTSKQVYGRFELSTVNEEKRVSAPCALCTMLQSRRQSFYMLPLIPILSTDGFINNIESVRVIIVVEISHGASAIQLHIECSSSLPSRASCGHIPAALRTFGYEDIRNTLLRCEHTHNLCVEEEGPLLTGLRVIDCLDRRVILAPAACSYMALSYVWGTSSVNEPLSDDRLPACTENTIEDAMKVCIGLGFRFLWVDRYCIDQFGDQNDIDFQINNMHLVYGGARLTLIASVGLDAHHGLPGVGKRERAPRLVASAGTCIFSIRSSFAQSLISQSRWETRGWTYQEEWFSTRCLYFTDDQTLFVCHHGGVSEGRWDELGGTYGGPLANSSAKKDHGTREIRRAIGSYTTRHLSYDRDILRAFQGVLSLFRGNGFCSHWGVPEIDAEIYSRNGGGANGQIRSRMFIYGLDWTFDRYVPVRRRMKPIRLKRRAGFPSWSWLSWDASIKLGSGMYLKAPATDVSMELDNGKLVSWSRLRRLLLCNGEIPSLSIYIHVTAWCVPVTLRRESDGTWLAEIPTMRDIYVREQSPQCVLYDFSPSI